MALLFMQPVPVSRHRLRLLLSFLPGTTRGLLPDLKFRESGTIFALSALSEQGPKPELRTLASPESEDAFSRHLPPSPLGQYSASSE